MNKKIRQKEVAEWLVLKESFLSDIFNGKKRPSPVNAKRMEMFTGISLDDWLFLPVDELKKKIYAVYFYREDKS